MTMRSSMEVALEDARELIKKYQEALEAALIACPYDCGPDSYCGRCRIPLEALGMISEEEG